MKKPKIAIVSFPGTNGDTDNLKTFWRCGFDAFVFRWNDSLEKLTDIDGYFIGAGFSYEDRGRAGMVAGRDPIFRHLHSESEKGKVIVGHCNGCQVLVESGLIPVGDRLRMCMARNAIRENGSWRAPGFLNQWIWMTPTCARDRCCASDWSGPMHIPIAHGEGRFITRDPELLSALEENDQIAFRYCDQDGRISAEPDITLNGSTDAIAGICNPAGNVVGMMPHAERTGGGDPYFVSIRRWIESGRLHPSGNLDKGAHELRIGERVVKPVEIYIDTIIVNNEERTVEQAARRVIPGIVLKQFRYLAPTEKMPEDILGSIGAFNPNKEVAYVQRGGVWFKWNADDKSFDRTDSPLMERTYLRRDEPDVGAQTLGKGSETGVCYSCANISDGQAFSGALHEVFANLHASTLEIVHSSV